MNPTSIHTSILGRLVLGHAPLLVLLQGLVGGCDPGTDVALRAAPDVDLTRYGIASVSRDGTEDTATLRDASGRAIGSVHHAADADGLELTVELDGEISTFQWAQTQAAMECGGTEGAMDDACADALDIGAAISEADGIDVPDYELASPSDFRMACETINTTSATCSGCRDRAYRMSQYGTWDGGSCDQGWLWASCSHTYCSGGGGFELEEGANN